MPTVQLALFGQNINNSLSPHLYQHFAKQCNINLFYKKIEVTPENFLKAWQAFVGTGGQGANITIPHKLVAKAVCTELSTAAQLAESVNTLKIISPTQCYGDNTDGSGFIEDLVNYHGHPLTGKNILLLGAGGAARGILPLLIEQQPNTLFLVNRTLSNALWLENKYATVSAYPLTQIPAHEFDIVINTSEYLSLAELTINFAPNAIAYDIRYKDGAKEFLFWAKSQGAKFIYDGYGMLLEQAAKAFQLWFNTKPSSEELRDRPITPYFIGI